MNETWFAIHRDTLVVLAVMAVITYVFRAGGYWLMGRVALSPRFEAGLAYLPGSVITALMIPAALEVGIAGILGVAMVALSMWYRQNLMLAMVAGIASVWLVRQIT